MSFVLSYVAPLARWDFFVEQMEIMHSFQSHGHDGLPSLLPHHISWIDIVDVRAWSPFIVCEVLYHLDGRKVEAANSPHIIPCMGSRPSLQFSSMV
jgi:hypothetical protein